MCSVGELCAKFSTRINEKAPDKSQGLTTDALEQASKEHGANKLSPPKDKPEIIKYLAKFVTPFMVMLQLSSVALFGVYGAEKTSQNLILAVALLVAVIFMCTIQYIQDRQAGNMMSLLSKMMPQETTVVRDGRNMQVAATGLVPGDVVLLTGGDRVPADVRILAATEFRVENSSLTGESALIPLGPKAQSDAPTESRNVAFMSTMAMTGQAVALVIRTGDETMIGKIATMASQSPDKLSNMEREVRRFVYYVAALAIAMAICFFTVAMARGQGIRVALVYGFIIVMIANIPQGLPLTVAVMLSVSVKRLRERNVLVKQPDIVESLGAASIIASDKTGTLTMNRMTVETLWLNRTFREARTIAVDRFAASSHPHDTRGGQQR